MTTIYVEADVGGKRPLRSREWWEHAGGCRKVWEAAMPLTDGLVKLDGMQAHEAAGYVRQGVQFLEAVPLDWFVTVIHSPEMEACALRALVALLERYPKATVMVI